QPTCPIPTRTTCGACRCRSDDEFGKWLCDPASSDATQIRETNAERKNRRRARRCRAPNRALQNTRPAKAENKCPAAALDAPSANRKAVRSLRRNGRNHADREADSGARRKDERPA